MLGSLGRDAAPPKPDEVVHAATKAEIRDGPSLPPLGEDIPKWEFPKIWGTLFGGPCSPDPIK